eukprot:scaffold257_cov18-Tisochrysis_lutea.AAC.3
MRKSIWRVMDLLEICAKGEERKEKTAPTSKHSGRLRVWMMAKTRRFPLPLPPCLRKGEATAIVAYFRDVSVSISIDSAA